MNEEEIIEADALVVADFKNLAKEYITLFFSSYKINKDLLTVRNISLVLNLNVCDGLPLIYDAMSGNEEFRSVNSKKKIDPDIAFVISMLGRCSKLLVPRCFAVGIIAIYLELFKNCTIDYERS